MQSYAGLHFEHFARHFAGFDAPDRQRLAELYGAPDAAPRALARHMSAKPDVVAEIIRRELTNDNAWSLLRELAFDHDIAVPIAWADKEAHGALIRLGLYSPKFGDPRPGEGTVPAGIGAVVSPLLDGLRTTFPTLIGNVDEPRRRHIAMQWGFDADVSRVELGLTLSERFGDPETLEDLLMSLPDPEYIGAGLMAIELGGMCYWTEVFGCDIDGGSAGPDNVVPLMRREDRNAERDIAEVLLNFGLIFRIEADAPHPMVVVPEELWMGLFNVGRTWLMDWVASSTEILMEQGTRRGNSPEERALQPALKWLICEAAEGRLQQRSGAPACAGTTLERLSGVGGGTPAIWDEVVQTAVALGALRPDGDHLRPNEAFVDVLDLPHSNFVRQVLFEWCVGYVGAEADTSLPAAIGVDETWRQAAIQLLESKNEFIPVWLRSEGVQAELTGTGVLRHVDGSDPERIMMEVGICNSLVWSDKLMLLDLLSMLEPDLWYPMEQLVGMAQLSCSLCGFSQIVHVLEQPSAGHYIPVQRASFLTDPFQVADFEAWVKGIVTHLLQPLGVARISDEGDAVWLDTTHLRIDTPPGLSDVEREQFILEVFSGFEVDFQVPQPARGLRTVSDVPPGDEIGLDSPMRAIMERVAGRAIGRFDGVTITLEPPS